MSHIPQTSVPRPASADATFLPGSRLTIAGHTLMGVQQQPQARRDFDAALRRATDGKPSRTSDRNAEPETPVKDEPKGLASLAPLSALSGGLTATPAGEQQALAGSATPPQPQPATTGSLPTAIPTALAAQTQGTAIGQQWRMSVPLDSNATSALVLRLTQSGIGHWQMRLGADNQTRQQLLPHMDRLRQRLHEHGQGRFDDFDFDDSNEDNTSA